MLQVIIPVQMAGLERFEVRFEVTARTCLEQWQQLRPELVVDGVAKIPGHLAHHERAVPDKLAYVWRDDDLHLVGEERPVRPGGIFLAAESPHKDEFDGRDRPIEPLYFPATRQRVKDHLPRLIRQAIERQSLQFNDVDVVLGNPIQFQCSLQSLLIDPEIALQPAIRNAVWRNLFRARLGDQFPIKANFQARVAQGAPALLILAPTSDVRNEMCRFGRALAPHVVEVWTHPCRWHDATSLA